MYSTDWNMKSLKSLGVVDGSHWKAYTMRSLLIEKACAFKIVHRKIMCACIDALQYPEKTNNWKRKFSEKYNDQSHMSVYYWLKHEITEKARRRRCQWKRPKHRKSLSTVIIHTFKVLFGSLAIVVLLNIESGQIKSSYYKLIPCTLLGVNKVELKH